MNTRDCFVKRDNRTIENEELFIDETKFSRFGRVIREFSDLVELIRK